MVLRLLLSLLCLVLDVTASTRRTVHQGWRACRVSNAIKGCRGLPEASVWNVSALPTTALLVLLEHRQIPGWNTSSLEQLFFSTHMADLPDIFDTGRAYYTLVYELDLTQHVLEASAQCSDKKLAPPRTRTTVLEFAGINYQSRAFLDGIPLPEIDGTTADGMFRRRFYDITCGHSFHIVIGPPLHPGTCRAQSSSCQGQGGNHELAKDGATAQYMLGWDWAQSMPDRATGFYGAVHVKSYDRYPIALRNVAIHTLTLPRRSGYIDLELRLSLVPLVRDEMYLSSIHMFTRKLIVQADWGEKWEISNFTILPSQTEIYKRLRVHQTNQVHLWWPHGMVPQGKEAHLHKFNVSLVIDHHVSDYVELDLGIRTVTTFLDTKTQGQTFLINGKRLYLVGGNWIGTDQTLKYSASPQRYCDELALHKHAGLNLIRVWGGGTTERNDFYQCADRLGLLVYQEFWMTGDNNGRWAGNYSWPLDHKAYLANVQDTVLRLRRFASLLFYGGCNECLAPPGLANPPRDIDHEIQGILNLYDPGRFYIPSSMSGENVADPFQNPAQWYNRSFGLSFADGPYGMLMPPVFFEPNPGLDYKNFSIGFQPEIGSTAAPTYHGLLRFMTATEAEMGFPQRNTGQVGESWAFHRFQPWKTPIPNTSETYDHVYSYFAPDDAVSVVDWCAAAQLAAHAQYQHLFNGFISHVFEYTTAVVMWKSQSPWPSLRGFLYDFYLETTGSLRGVRTSLASSLSTVLDAATWQLKLVNRFAFELGNSSSRFTALGGRFEWINLHGEILVTGELWPRNGVVASMSSALLGDENDALVWPDQCTAVCFLRLSTVVWINDRKATLSHKTWHWLTDPSLDEYGRRGSDFSALGAMRKRQNAKAVLVVDRCDLNESGFTMFVSILVQGTDVLFYPTWILRTGSGAPVLPLFDKMETDVVLLPGKTYRRALTSSATLPKEGDKTSIQVGLESWNGPLTFTDVVCQDVHAQTFDSSRLDS